MHDNWTTSAWLVHSTNIDTTNCAFSIDNELVHPKLEQYAYSSAILTCVNVLGLNRINIASLPVIVRRHEHRVMRRGVNLSGSCGSQNTKTKQLPLKIGFQVFTNDEWAQVFFEGACQTIIQKSQEKTNCCLRVFQGLPKDFPKTPLFQATSSSRTDDGAGV